MPLPFKPPLSPHEQAIYTTLPKLEGSVVHPDYYPRQHRERGERQFLEWCDQHPRSEWPQWVNDWHINFCLKTPRAKESVGSQGDDARAVEGAATRGAVA